MFDVYGQTDLLDFSANVIAKENQKLIDADIGWNTFERNRDLKKSGNKKANAFRWIYMIIVFLIFSVGILMILRRKFDYFFIDIIMVIVLSVGIIYILVLYLDINSRSLTDYDKIRPDASTLVSTKKMKKKKAKYGISEEDDSLEDEEDVLACIGQACCLSGGTTWNDTIKRCVVIEGFTSEIYTKYS